MEKSCKCMEQQIKLWGSIPHPSYGIRFTTIFPFTSMYIIIGASPTLAEVCHGFVCRVYGL